MIALALSVGNHGGDARRFVFFHCCQSRQLTDHRALVSLLVSMEQLVALPCRRSLFIF